MKNIARIKRRQAERQKEQYEQEIQQIQEDLAMELLFDVIFDHDKSDPNYNEEVRLHWGNAEYYLGHALPDKLYVKRLRENLPVTYIILKSDYFKDEK